jgi:hypothetical protein
MNIRDSENAMLCYGIGKTVSDLVEHTTTKKGIIRGEIGEIFYIHHAEKFIDRKACGAHHGEKFIDGETFFAHHGEKFKISTVEPN